MMVISHTSTEEGLGPVSIRQTRWMPPRSIRMNMPAQQMHTIEQMTAGIEIFLKASMLNTCAELATIRPPADRPTNSMNRIM